MQVLSPGSQDRTTTSENGVTVVRDTGIYDADYDVSRFSVVDGNPVPITPPGADIQL